MVLSSGDAKAKALQSFSMTADDTTADLKKLFSNPSFLKGTQLIASGPICALLGILLMHSCGRYVCRRTVVCAFAKLVR